MLLKRKCRSSFFEKHYTVPRPTMTKAALWAADRHH